VAGLRKIYSPQRHREHREKLFIVSYAAGAVNDETSNNQGNNTDGMD
jgi:hypothetical protein